MCALPVFVWGFYSYWYAFPGFMLEMNAWDLIGTASYTLAFALLESLVISLPFLVLAIVLPSRVFREHLVVLTAIIVFVSSIWMIYANYHLINFADLDLAQSLPVFALYLATVALPIAIALRSKRVDQTVRAIIQRISVLVYVYTALAGVGVLIVLFRNI